MKRGSSLRFMECPMPQTSLLVLGCMAGLLELLRRVLDGLDDVDVAGAAAQVPGDGLADVGLARVGVPGEERRARPHHARRAEAALQAVLLPEALLHGVELAVLLEAFDGGDLVPIRLDREHRARLDGRPVEKDRAGAAVRG